MGGRFNVVLNTTGTKSLRYISHRNAQDFVSCPLPLSSIGGPWKKYMKESDRATGDERKARRFSRRIKTICSNGGFSNVHYTSAGVKIYDPRRNTIKEELVQHWPTSFFFLHFFISSFIFFSIWICDVIFVIALRNKQIIFTSPSTKE